MKKRSRLALVAVLALVLAACGGDTEETTTTAGAGETTTTEEVVDETTTTEATVEVGTEENPIQVLFVPSVSAEEIIAGGELLEQTLEAETGYSFTVDVPTSYGAVVEELCANPAATMAFIPAQAYVLGNDLCGVEVALKALRFGYTEYWTEFIVPRDSDIESFEDLAGRTWAYPDATSTSGFLFPQGMFLDSGIEPGDTLEAGGHNQVVLAVYQGDADFGTTFFSPAIDGEGSDLWDGDPANADVPDDLVDSCTLDGEGEIVCGEDYYPRDARRNIRDTNPDVIQQVRIVTLSDPIPNDTLSFGPEFDEMQKESIIAALTAFASDDPDGFSTAFEAYSWSGVATTTDAEFDAVRAIVAALGLSPDDL
jgi:phosphonate transport system substrate-binding protein